MGEEHLQMIQETLLVASLALAYVLVALWSRPKRKKNYVYVRAKDGGKHLKWK